MSEMLDAALGYARHGELILPLRENGKEPATDNGFYDASINDAEIEKWFVKPTVNIGIRVGQESNIIVIDPDNKGGKDGRARLAELEARLGSLPLTRTIETRYGKHYYFKFPDKWRDALIKPEYAPGLDIKAKGYVVAPPSTVDGFTYFVKNDVPAAELPDAWVKEAIKTAPDLGDWARVRPRGTGSSVCEEHSISLGDVLTLPPDARKVGDGYLIKHPVHGATGKGNLFVNAALNLWCCYRHGTGGDPITWVAVREHFIECADAGPLDRETTLKCKDVLRREGRIQDRRQQGEQVEQEAVESPPKWFDGDMSSTTIYVNGKPTIKKLPKIPETVVVDGPKTIEELLEVYHEHLYFKEDYNVTGPICAFLGNFTQQDPYIIGIIGPSGSIKTEMVRSFGETQNQYCYPISSITEHTFVSGIDMNIDTIPLLRGRVLTIKDLTTLLSKNEDIRSGIFADMREFTDGFLHKEFGNGVKKEYHDIHSSVLFASTPAIERYYSMYANLGTRMLFMRPQNDPVEARKKSKANQKRGMKPIRKTLQDAMLSFVDANVKRLVSGEPLPEMSEEIDDEIGEYCDLLAWLRHPLHHDFRGNIDEIAPDPEFPTRLMNAISLLTQMHAFVYRRDVVEKEDLEFAKRIIADNVPTNRAAILTHLTTGMQSTSTLSDKSGISPRSLLIPLDELAALGLVEKTSRENAGKADLDGRANHYRLSFEWATTIQRLNSVIRYGGRIGRSNSEKHESPPPLVPDDTVHFSSSELDALRRDMSASVFELEQELKHENGQHYKTAYDVELVVRSRVVGANADMLNEKGDRNKTQEALAQLWQQLSKEREIEVAIVNMTGGASGALN